MKIQNSVSYLAALFLIIFPAKAFSQVEVKAISQIKPEMNAPVCITDAIQLKNGDYYAISEFSHNESIETSKHLYKIVNSELNIEYTSESEIEFLLPIDNIIYFMSSPCINSFHTISKELLDCIPGQCPHGPTGFTCVNDSIFAYTDWEFDDLYLVTTDASFDTTISIGDPIYRRLLCFDSFNNKLLISGGDCDIYAYSLPDFTAEEIYISKVDRYYGFNGFTCDMYGNIFVTHSDTNGVYLVNSETNELTQISELPKQPASLYYNKHNNSLVATDVSDTSIYNIALANNTITNIQKQLPGIQNMGIYPNPTNDILNINFTCTNSSTGKIELISCDGKHILKSNNYYFSTGLNKSSIDVSNLHPGAYFITISDQNSKKTELLIIK